MITRTAIINDVHIPFNDTRLLDTNAKGLVMDIIADRKLDRLIINGDLLDMYGVNSHGPKNPIVLTTVEDELNAGREFINNLVKRFPDLEIIYLMGNHEFRLNRFILQHSKPLHGLLTIEKYLRLDELGIEWHPYNHKYQLEKSSCFIQHSPPSYGVSGTMTSLLKKLDQTHIYGCTHREQKSCLTGGSGHVYACYFNGWLGSSTETEEHKEVFSYAKGHENWQNCFTIVTVVDGVDHFINQYSIRDYSVCVDGFFFQG